MQRGSLKQKLKGGVKVWRAQWRENGKGRTRIIGRCSDMSRADARAELDKILGPVNEQERRKPSTSTLRQFTEDEYLVAKTRVWKASTRATTEQIIGTHILSALGARPMPAITRKDLQALLDEKAEAGLSKSVVGHIRWQLSAIFEMAAADGVILRDPTGGLVMPKCKGKVDKRTIGVDEIIRCQMMLDTREQLIYCLAVREGMRPGEIMGLKLGDIREGLIYIERRIYRGKEGDPKSFERRIAPTATTLAVLNQYRELLTDTRPEAWLFPSERGKTPLSYSGVYRRRIQPAFAKVGLGWVNFQILRRSCVTELSEAEPDPALRAKMIGHSVDVHENVYRQAKPDALKLAADRMEKHLQ